MTYVSAAKNGCHRLVQVARALSTTLFFLFLPLFLTACGFKLETAAHFPVPLQSLYLSAKDPYGPLMRYLKLILKSANVALVKDPALAKTHLVILSDNSSQDLLSVSNSQQVRQYSLHVTINFQVTDNTGHILFGPETLSDSRTITIQTNQILAGSNEIHTFDEQIHRALAIAMVDRLSSEEAGQIIAANSKISKPT